MLGLFLGLALLAAEVLSAGALGVGCLSVIPRIAAMPLVFSTLGLRALASGAGDGNHDDEGHDDYHHYENR